MIRHWHSLTQEVKCLRFVSLGVFENKIRQDTCGSDFRAFFPTLQRFSPGDCLVFTVVTESSVNCSSQEVILPVNWGTGWTMDDIDHVSMACE